ncbi:hypothetical protein DICVIV_07750 [Dictyocaulus viviparus]|uniref:Uncharacterized protein n=1 Tax=Dictyocaulus viviparus TaxID=29172 RepID=A0A0D8XQX7_DICVI|nr:hypothetical protein DICVIV_07750 [Dictyocaulus viviparus]
MWCALLFFSSIVYSIAASTNNERSSLEVCRQVPSLYLCRLYGTLQESLYELQDLLQDTEPENAAVTNLMHKRKSAFVRFGKRSVDEVPEPEKRKSAFVRFGRSVNIPEKRKSQYIRFGRK